MAVTIKQLAEEVSVSKVAMTKWLQDEKNGFADKLEKVGNKYVLTDDTADAVVRAYTARRQPKRAETINTASDAENSLSEAVIALLREQLAEKDKMIDRLQTQVENLQAANADMVKALRESNAIQYHQLTESEKVEEPIEKVENDSDRNETAVKKSLWNRLKGLF